jgi:hypothetical protein
LSAVWLLRAIRVVFSSTGMGVMLVPCWQSRYEPEEGHSHALLGDAEFAALGRRRREGLASRARKSARARQTGIASSTVSARQSNTRTGSLSG